MVTPNTVKIDYITTYANMQPIGWRVTFTYRDVDAAVLHSFDEAYNIQVLLEQMGVKLEVSVIEEDVEDAK